MLIDGHPNIAIPPESQIYNRFGAVFASYGDLCERRNRLRFIGALLGDVFIRRWQLDVTANDVEQRIRQPDRIGVIEALFGLYAEKNGAMRWGDKTPEHVRHLPEIVADFPNAMLIHLVRDGRDVAEAYRRMIFGPVSAVGLAREWRREVMAWRTFCAEHGTANTLVIHYEDLVAAPRETMSKVFGFLGEPYVDTISDYASTPLSRERGATEGGSHSSLRRGISTAKIGVYRKTFTSRDIEIFESIAEDALVTYGYERDCTAPRAVTGRERLFAFIADRVVRWYRKFRHPFALWMVIQHRLRLARQVSGRHRRHSAPAST